MSDNNSLPEPDPHEEEEYAALVARHVVNIPFKEMIAELLEIDREENQE